MRKNCTYFVLLLLLFNFNYLFAQNKLNALDIIYKWQANFDTLKQGSFDVTRINYFTFDTVTYNSHVEFDATTLSKDSIVKHLVTFIETIRSKKSFEMQLYFDGKTIYIIDHTSKTCRIVNADSLGGFLKAINSYCDYYFIPFVSKSKTRFKYCISPLLMTPLEKFDLSDVYKNVSKWKLITNDAVLVFTKEAVGNVDFDPKFAQVYSYDFILDSTFTTFKTISYKANDRYHSNQTNIYLTPVKPYTTSLLFFDINYYLENYRRITD